MEDINEIIFKVFNNEEIDEDEENLLLKKNIAIYNFYSNNEVFQLDMLERLSIPLIKRIKDIKTKSICEECGDEHSIRYKYRLYIENFDKKLCDECIKKYSWEYVTLRKIEKNLKLVNEEYFKLELYNNKNLSKAFHELKNIIKERERIGKWLYEFSKNYLRSMDKISAYCKANNGEVIITSYGDENNKICNLCDIKKFENLEVKYNEDCENIRLRFEEHCKRPYYLSSNKKNTYVWIIPKGFSIETDYYYGDYEVSVIDFIEKMAFS